MTDVGSWPTGDILGGAPLTANVSVQEQIQGKELASEPGSEMVPGRAVAYDGLNGQEQKTEDRERRRERMNALCVPKTSSELMT
jgi:hypothetical protein